MYKPRYNAPGYNAQPDVVPAFRMSRFPSYSFYFFSLPRYTANPNIPGQVSYGAIRRSSASPRPPCDGIPSASVWPSPRQTPGPPCPHPSPYATTKRVGALWHGPAPRISTGKNPMGGILRRKSRHMPIEA